MAHTRGLSQKYRRHCSNTSMPRGCTVLQSEPVQICPGPWQFFVAVQFQVLTRYPVRPNLRRRLTNGFYYWFEILKIQQTLELRYPPLYEVPFAQVVKLCAHPVQSLKPPAPATCLLARVRFGRNRRG